MTSGHFVQLDPALIHIDRENRQRTELRDIDELAESIRNVGLINPPVIDKQYNLVAGERRLTACVQLGLNPVSFQYVEDLSKDELYLIELEENVKRSELAWDDKVRAIAEYHRLLGKDNPDWTPVQTAEAMGVSSGVVRNHLLVEAHMDNEIVQGADKYSKALNASQRIAERKQANAKRNLGEEIGKILGETGAEIPEGTSPRDQGQGQLTETPRNRAVIQEVDFHLWARDYRGEPFNLIHCDFPYGVGVGDKSGQSARGTTGSYSDTKEDYFNLLETFCNHGDNFIDPSAHLIFWFSMDYYNETIVQLEAGGWSVSRFPLIWSKSDNAGIIPDANRGPRRTYETALFASRGDRKIVRAVANSIAAPTTREFHTSEKPRPVLTHFMRMICDEHSRVFDPTAGSGNAIRVADALGASTSLGLELDPEFGNSARENLKQGMEET